MVAQLEKELPGLMAEQKTPGLGIVLLRDGKPLWRRGFGVRDDVSKAPVDNDTVFEIASISKTVFSYVVLKLSEKGVLALDTPLTKYSPERRVEGDPRLDLITARHVLTHTTGLQNWRSDNEPLAIHFTPGEKFSYSGEAFGYLQSVVTHLTGHVNPNKFGTYERGFKVYATDFDAFMQAHLLGPFGMKSSSYLWPASYEQHAAQPHDEQGEQSPKRHFGATDAARYGAAGGLQMTATDYARYLIEILDPKPADAVRLKSVTRAEMIRPQVMINKTMSQALGWQVYHTDAGDLICHGGGNPGFSSFVVAALERKVGAVFLTNADNGYKVIDRLLQGDVIPQFLGGRISYPLL
jgi:CubicO group peptidase (beta-lactamase class C family)